MHILLLKGIFLLNLTNHRYNPLNMKKALLFVILLFSAFTSFAIDIHVNKHQLDSVLKILDKTISQKDLYTQKKIQTIDSLTNQEQKEKSLPRYFSIYGELFSEYKNFQMDSALVIAQKRKQIAEKIGIKTDETLAEMNIAEVMIVTGMYKEALDILDKQDRRSFTNTTQFSTLYHLYHSLYMIMAQYSFTEQEKIRYDLLEYQYKDSILSTLSPDDVVYKMVQSSKLVKEKNYDDAFAISLKLYRENLNNTHMTAMISHNIVDIFTAYKMRNEKKYFLTISAINDIQSGVKEYMSLSELAVILYEDGDLDRAYNYMQCSLEDAIFCKARLRTLELSKALPIINMAYEQKMQQEKDRLATLLFIIIILAVILFIAFSYIYKKLRELAIARRSLKTINEELKLVNTDLNKLNKDLSESNYIKEEYIGYVFSICSTYIDRLDDFRKVVNRKIKVGQTEDLFKQTNSPSFVNDELKEFYKSFDTVFLNLYPNFIKDFNSLLLPEEQVWAKEGELLSPELRIYALVRLGINDSVKIASFLHYSPQTVYNYRLKIRNKSMISKDFFSEAVRKLGKIKE